MNPNFLQRHAAEVSREIAAERFDRHGSGLLLNRLGVFLGGAMRVRDFRDGSVQVASIDANLLPTEALVHVLNSILPPTGGYTPITAWYLALFEGNYTPTAALTAANFVATANEFEAYVSATRPALTVPAAATTASTATSEVIVTLNGTGPHNIYGGAIVSASAKGATSGKLLAAVRFDNPRLNMSAGDKLGVQYVLSAADDSA